MSAKVIGAAGIFGAGAGYWYMQQDAAATDDAALKLKTSEPSPMDSLMANAGSAGQSAKSTGSDRPPAITTAHLQKMLEAARDNEKENAAELKRKKIDSREYGSRITWLKKEKGEIKQQLKDLQKQGK
jgi:hypothetical protein